MPIYRHSVKNLVRMIGREEAREVIALSSIQESLEFKWRRRLIELFGRLEEVSVSSILLNETIDPVYIGKAFEAFFFEQSMDVMRRALESVEKQMPSVSKGDSTRMTTIKKGARLPRNLRELMALWDDYRKRGKLPPRQKQIAERVKKAYLNKLQSVWEKHSDDFRKGKVATQEEIVEKIRQASRAQIGRSKMIVETENTRYFNGIRKDFYDQSADVTHYLFIAIRDAATTKWCKSRTGLVFKKGTNLFERNVPPCHWNCRSEIVPLTPMNKRHLALIQNPRLAAETHKLVPLPNGWNRKMAVG